MLRRTPKNPLPTTYDEDFYDRFHENVGRKVLHSAEDRRRQTLGRRPAAQRLATCGLRKARRSSVLPTSALWHRLRPSTRTRADRRHAGSLQEARWEVG